MTTRPPLWQKALDALKKEDADVIVAQNATPWDSNGLVAEIERYRVESKGKPIIKLHGENFFVRDLLAKVSTWVQRFAQVGDAVMQYDPGHAALPWAAVRLVLQLSMNNMAKHAAVLEGIEKIAYYLVWGKIEEGNLLIPYDAHDQLERDFVKLYTAMLKFMARSIRFLKGSKIAAFLSGDTKFLENITNMAELKQSIESYSIQILSQTSHKQYAEVQRIGTQVADLDRAMESHSQALDHRVSHETQKIADQLAELKKPIIRIERTVSMQSQVLDHQMREEILNWASKIPFRKHFDVVCNKALAGTGQWLFNDDDFIDWQNCSRSQIFWLHGGSGSGKSTLVSILLQSLIDAHDLYQAPYPMYFFCSRNVAEPERADPEQILRCLLRQASDLPGGPPLHPHLQARFDARRTAGNVSADEAVKIILHTIKDRPLSYIVIDALDECDRYTRDILIDALVEILSQSASLVKIFVTSRDSHMDIALRMTDYPAVSVDASRNQADVDSYVEHSVRKAIGNKKLLLGRVSTDLQDQIDDGLRSGAQGMFRWVELQLKFLCTLKTTQALLRRLERLPPGLKDIYQELYDHNMQERVEEEAAITRKVLSWLLVAQRPLSTLEMIKLVCAPRSPELSKEAVVDICFDLVGLDEGLDQFRFSHLSVREFLEDRLDEYAPTITHAMATRACLNLVTSSDAIDETYYYAAMHWPLHAEVAIRDGPQRAMKELDDFLVPGNQDFLRYAQCIQGRILKRSSDLDTQELRWKLYWATQGPALPLFVTACFDLQPYLRLLVSGPMKTRDLQLKTEYGHTALDLASEYGKIENVRTILSAGADLDARGFGHGTALQAAVAKGHIDVVKVLLENGANVNTEGRASTVLQEASSCGYTKIVELLLQHGASVNLRGGEYALQEASRGGHTRIVKLLLENGADVDVKGGDFGNALQAASYAGSRDIVKLLLEKGADVNAEGGVYCNALQAASYGGHTDVVKLLLEKGANVNAQGGECGTALQAAAYRGNEVVFQLLLDHLAVVDVGAFSALVKSHTRLNPHSWKLLFANDVANVGAPGAECYEFAIESAIEACDAPFLRLLLAYDADFLMAPGNKTFETALQQTAFQEAYLKETGDREFKPFDNIEIRQLLQEHGARALLRASSRSQRSRSCESLRTPIKARVRVSHSTSRHGGPKPRAWI